MFRDDSLLKDSVLMLEDEYNAIWKKLAHLKQVASTTMRTSRHSKPLWESLETILNKMFADVSVNDREGRISIALDDDKIWFGSKVSITFAIFNNELPLPPSLVAHIYRCLLSGGQRERTRLICST
jgi:hypothetical protein